MEIFDNDLTEFLNSLDEAQDTTCTCDDWEFDKEECKVVFTASDGEVILTDVEEIYDSRKGIYLCDVCNKEMVLE